MIPQFLIFIRRIRHCAGFGIQSPTDYAFVREVIYERWPYACYPELEEKYPDISRLELKLAQLLLRVANYAQSPEIGFIGDLTPSMYDHLQAGCLKSKISLLPNDHYTMSDRLSLVIATGIKGAQRNAWKSLIKQEHIISFDLYYLGLAFYRPQRYSETHIVNFY